MGLELTSNYKGAPSLRGGYSMLLTFREVVALAFDKEFGEHYNLLRSVIIEREIDAWDKKANEILENERFKEEDYDILNFLFAPDDRGSISYKTAKKIYELIKDLQPKFTLRYTYHSKNDWEDVKELLLGCYKNRAKFRWS